MKWLALTLAGPTLWAVVFVAVYGLHGVACAGHGVPGMGARAAMIAVWAGGMAAHVAVLRALPAGPARAVFIPHAGAWIGLVATAFTLFPLLVVSSC
ncbi:hypothetical protein [Roseinatronobacter sp. NSM]|uniref:hypothetical protein n=1 Tax=Roseinatronobacter sp. NSM TaxID=3457785 RepID=UPI004036A42B